MYGEGHEYGILRHNLISDGIYYHDINTLKHIPTNRNINEHNTILAGIRGILDIINVLFL